MSHGAKFHQNRRFGVINCFHDLENVSVKFITEYLRWIIYLKFLVYLHGYAVFDKTWSSKLIFISSETETANRTKPQYEPSDTLVPKMPNKNFCLHICIFHIYVVNFLGIITCSILKSILTILVSIVIFTSIDQILEKNLQYLQVLSQFWLELRLSG